MSDALIIQQNNRIISLLEEIRDLLKTQPAPVQWVPPNLPASNMWQCMICKNWIMNGTPHSCVGKITYDSGPRG